MNRERTEELWLRFLADQLSAEESAELLEALRSDAEWGKELLEDRAIDAALREFGRPAAEAAEFQDEVEAVLAAEAAGSQFMAQMKRRLKQEADRPKTSSSVRVACLSDSDLQPISAFWTTQRIAAAVAVLFITAGLLGLWLTWQPTDPPLSKRQERRRQTIIEQLCELNLERRAVETANRMKPPPRFEPGRPPSDPATRTTAQEEAEEAARFIEARQRFVMQQLRMFHSRGPLPDDLDVDEFEPGTVRTEEPVVARTCARNIGDSICAASAASPLPRVSPR